MTNNQQAKAMTKEDMKELKRLERERYELELEREYNYLESVQDVTHDILRGIK